MSPPEGQLFPFLRLPTEMQRQVLHHYYEDKSTALDQVLIKPPDGHMRHVSDAKLLPVSKHMHHLGSTRSHCPLKVIFEVFPSGLEHRYHEIYSLMFTKQVKCLVTPRVGFTTKMLAESPQLEKLVLCHKEIWILRRDGVLDLTTNPDDSKSLVDHMLQQIMVEKPEACEVLRHDICSLFTEGSDGSSAEGVHGPVSDNEEVLLRMLTNVGKVVEYAPVYDDKIHRCGWHLRQSFESLDWAAVRYNS